MDVPTKAEINVMLEDIMTCPLNRRATLYVVMDSIRYVTQKPDAPGYLIDERVLLYEIMPSEGYPLNRFGRIDPIQHKRVAAENPAALGHALQRVDKLTKVLKKIPLQDNDEVFLVTWDHGSGFGVFRQTDPPIQDPTVQTPLTHQLDGFPYLKLFWDKAMEVKKLRTLIDRKNKQLPTVDIKTGYSLYKILPDGENDFSAKTLRDAQQQINESDPGNANVPEILKNGELAEVIKNWLSSHKNNKVGVLLMMNCWMMNLHTLYSLRDSVKYLVAPQGFIGTPGYNYRDILLSIYNSSPLPISPEQLAINTIGFSKNDFFIKRAADMGCKGTIDTRVLIAARLDYPHGNSPLLALIDRLQAFAGRLLTLLNENAANGLLDLLSFVRALSFDFTNNQAYLIDLPNYLQSLVSAIELVNPGLLQPDLKSDIGDFVADMQTSLPVIPPKFIGTQWHFTGKSLEHWKLTGMPPSGYSIFFPTSAIKFNSDANLMDNVKNDELLNKQLSTWKKLVNEMYGNIIP